MSIELKNVSYTYMPGTPMERQALMGVNMTLERGRFYAIAGHTGSGKSTLIQQISGLLTPTSGEVLVEGVPLKAKSKEDKKQAALARRRIGMVFQYPEQQLFEETVAADVAFGPKNQGLAEEEIAQRVQKALALVGLDYEAYGDKSPFQISGGQKRRAAIAGVLAMEPEYLILDEPTAGLDPKGREAILELISTLQKGGRGREPMTIIMVSHAMDDILRLADEMFVMQEGRLTASGAPAEVFERWEVLSEAGLEPPKLLMLMERLREAGLAERGPVRNLREAVQAVKRGLSKC